MNRVSPGDALDTGYPPLARAGWYKHLQAAIMATGSDRYERVVEARKRALLGGLEGTVLEVGPGTGPNLPFFKPDVRWIGVEPNPYMHRYLRRQAERLGRDVELRAGTAERLPAPDGSADGVVTSLVLCSVRDPAGTLREILRVLKPGGRYVFLEHVAAPAGTWSRRLQRGIRPLWRMLGDGCEPDRQTWLTIEGAGFSHVEIEHFRVPFPVVAPHISGMALK